MAKKTKAAPVVEATEDDDLLEDLDANEAEDEKPAKEGKKASAKDEITFGVADLCKLLEEKTGKPLKPRDLRTQIRRMAREETPRVNREITAGNRTRYDWSGPNDPEVKAIIKAVLGGEVDEAKKEALDALKARKAAKGAAEGKSKKKGKKSKPAEDDDE